MMRDVWSVILILGLIGWLFSTIMLMLKAFPRRDEFDASSGKKWGASALISFFIWIAGLLFA
jgi:hypothetical protein